MLPVRARPIVREELLRRISLLDLRALLLYAPAGFGKTSFVGQVTELWPEPAVICDVSDTQSELALARRVVAGLLQLPNDLDLASRAEAIGDDPKAWFELASELWRASGATLIVENAERLSALREAEDALGSIFEHSGSLTRLVVCSRVPLALRLGRNSTPAKVLVLRAADLRFSPSETRSLFAGCDLPDGTIEIIDYFSRGWPMVVALMRRFETEGRLLAVLRDVHSVDYDVLFQYLAQEVLSALTDNERQVIFAAASVPSASAAELVAILPDLDVPSMIAKLASNVPFLALRDDGSVEVHPLVAALMVDRDPQAARKLVIAAAEASAARGNALQGALLLLNIGEPDLAATMVTSSQVFLLATPTIETLEIASRLEPEVLIRHPALWAEAIFARAYAIPPHQWAAEGIRIWRERGRTMALSERLSVLGNLVNVLVNEGDHSHACSILDEFEASLADDEREIGLIVGQIWRPYMSLVRGYPPDMDAYWTQIRPMLTTDGPLASAEMEARARYARLMGDRREEHAAAVRSMEAARRSGQAIMIVLTLVEASYGAWLAAEDERFEQLVAELERAAVPNVIEGVRHFLDCARGRGDVAVAGNERLKDRSYGWLIAAGTAVGHERQDYLRRARIVADQANDLQIRVLSRLALACGVNSEARRLHLAEVGMLLDGVPRCALHGALERVQGSEPSGPSFEAFIGRFCATQQEPRNRWRLSHVNRLLSLDGKPVSLTEGQLEILELLGAIGKPMTIDELVEELRGEAAPPESQQSLRTLISRIRAACRDRSIVSSTPAGYRLNPDVEVDLQKLESLVRADRLGTASEARAMFKALSERVRLAGGVREWRLRLESRLDNLEHVIGMRLAEKALAARDADFAIEVTQTLLEHDPCDDASREILVKGLLQKNDRIGAMREIRSHEVACERELGITLPSPLRSLVDAPRVREKGPRSRRAAAHGMPTMPNEDEDHGRDPAGFGDRARSGR